MLTQFSDNTTVLLLTFLAAVAATDLTTRRIPNALTVTAAVFGVTLNWLAAGPDGALRSLEGLAVGLGVFLPLFLTRGFGAGDVKAMAAVGAFLGPQGAFFAALWTLVAGMVGGLLVLAGTAGLTGFGTLVRLWIFRAYVLCATGRMTQISAPPDEAAKRRFPYGAAIALGTIVSLAWGASRG